MLIDVPCEGASAALKQWIASAGAPAGVTLLVVTAPTLAALTTLATLTTALVLVVIIVTLSAITYGSCTAHPLPVSTAC